MLARQLLSPRTRTITPSALLQRATYSTTPSLSPLDTALRTALKSSMKSRDTFRTTVIKSLISDLQRVSHNPSPPSPAKTLSKAITSRLEAASDFLKSSPPRSDLSEQYNKEAEILKEFVVGKEGGGGGGMSLEEVGKVVEEVGEAMGKLTGKDLGRVVKAVREKLGETADGKTIAEAVKSWLSGKSA